jgi:hypothetical protein
MEDAMRGLILTGFLVLAIATPAFAQVGTGNAVLGVITGQSGAEIPGAQVTAHNDSAALE